MKHAGFLIPADEWEAFRRVAKARDLDRSQLLRRFIRETVAEHQNGPATVSAA
jgi:hypothetical protein